MTVGERIRQRRKEVGLTQAALADRVGVTKSSICHEERRGNGLGPVTAAAVADALGVSVHWLLTGERVSPAARADAAEAEVARLREMVGRLGQLIEDIEATLATAGHDPGPSLDGSLTEAALGPAGDEA